MWLYSTPNQNVFLVKWFGPFSQEEINEWEKDDVELFGTQKLKNYSDNYDRRSTIETAHTGWFKNQFYLSA